MSDGVDGRELTGHRNATETAKALARNQLDVNSGQLLGWLRCTNRARMVVTLSVRFLRNHTTNLSRSLPHPRGPWTASTEWQDAFNC